MPSSPAIETFAANLGLGGGRRFAPHPVEINGAATAGFRAKGLAALRLDDVASRAAKRSGAPRGGSTVDKNLPGLG